MGVTLSRSALRRKRACFACGRAICFAVHPQTGRLTPFDIESARIEGRSSVRIEPHFARCSALSASERRNAAPQESVATRPRREQTEVTREIHDAYRRS